MVVLFSPLLYCWSQGSQSWCLMYAQSGFHANVWKDWASLFLVHYPAHLVSKHPIEWTCQSPHYPGQPLAGPRTGGIDQQQKISNNWKKHILTIPSLTCWSSGTFRMRTSAILRDTSKSYSTSCSLRTVMSAPTLSAMTEKHLTHFKETLL